MGVVASLGGLVPTVFVAVTVNVYGVPADSPVTVIGLDDALPVSPPGLEVAVYCVIAEPPSELGTRKETSAELDVFLLAVTWIGCHGRVVPDSDEPPVGVTEPEALEATLKPIDVRACTVNV